MSLELDREFQTETKPENVWKEGWVPKTPDDATWLLAEYRRIKGEIKSIDDFVKRKINEIFEWYNRRTRVLRETEERILGLLEIYARNSGKKTISLPGGELRLRKQQPQFERDDAVLLEFLRTRELTQYIKAVESPDWRSLKADCQIVGTNVVLPNGEVVEGVTVHVPDEPAFTVKLDEAEEDTQSEDPA